MPTRERSVAADRAYSQSSDKVFQILECVASSPFPVRLQDISTQTNLSQSTVLRYLNALLLANYVYQEADTSRYALTWKICKLGQGLNSDLSLRSIASPFVNQLAARLEMGSCLVVNQDYQCVYLDCIDSPDTYMRTLRRIGRNAPLHATGSGKVLLASCSDSAIDDYIATKGLIQLTERTITDRDMLFEDISKIRERGFGIDDEECELGLRCLSVPLRCYSGKVCAALSVFGNSAEYSTEVLSNEIHPILCEIADTISLRLGYAPEKS